MCLYGWGISIDRQRILSAPVRFHAANFTGIIKFEHVDNFDRHARHLHLKREGDSITGGSRCASQSQLGTGSQGTLIECANGFDSDVNTTATVPA